MKKKFDIKYRPQIESGEYKVVTRDDHPVRICCWDEEEDYPIVALVKDYNEKSDYCYPMMCDKSGVSATKGNEKELFVLTPEPELTEFEKACKQMMLNWCERTEFDIEDDFVRNEAAILEKVVLRVFRPKYDATNVDEALIYHLATDWSRRKDKEDIVLTSIEKDAYRDGLIDMYKQFANELEEAFNHQDDVVYDRGYDKGYSNGNADALKDIPHWSPSTALNGIYDHRLVWNGYKIDIEGLFAKLPKDGWTDKFGCD